MAHVGFIVDHVIDTRGGNHPKEEEHDAPSTERGMDRREGTYLSISENAIPATAAMRITAGSVTLVNIMAPVTSGRWLRGGPQLIRLWYMQFRL